MTNWKKLFVASLVALAVSGAVRADTLMLRADHPQRYVVVRGDTLWDIASRFLKDPWMWPKIWWINPAIANPNLIYPGDLIVLRYENGRPVLEVQRGHQTVRLSPHTRTTPIEGAIPTIPLDAINQFLLHPRVLSEQQIHAAGYVLSAQEGRLISGADDTIYARDLKPGDDTYGIFHIGQAYRDPDSHDLLGYQALRVATVRMVAPGDPSTLHVVSSNREILVGDRALPMRDHDLDSHFLPHPPQHQVDGQIIAVLDGVSRIGQYQTVVLNLGETKGMRPGDVLAVYQEGQWVKDPHGGRVKLPDVRAGLIMVVRPFKRVSYGLVMNAQRDMRLLDRVTNP